MNNSRTIVTFLATAALTVSASEVAAEENTTPQANEPTFHVAAGIGVPEILHVEVGFYPVPGLSIDASVGVVIFNILGGFGATYNVEFSDGALRECFTMSGRARINLIDEPLTLRSGGERLGGTIDALAGYSAVTPSGLFGRVRLGAVFYDEDGFTAGPLLLAGVGWQF